ncbi:MAG: hypothetical protein KAG56_09515 [Sulfurovaceae bacterium]|nr:hypothetical protein [Sulfurovaceae bacterium]
MIISDSTTVITLLNIDRVDVLSNIFDVIYLPKRVYEEIVIDEKIELDKRFFVIKEIKDRELYSILLKTLDSGEAEAIVLAIEMKLSLIIDERKGRKVAKNLGINIFGFIGLLILNHKNGCLSKSDTIDVFYKAKEQGFRVGQRLEDEFLEMINE